METRGKCGVRYPVRRGEPPRTPRTQSLEWGFRDGGKPAAFKFLTVRNLKAVEPEMGDARFWVLVEFRLLTKDARSGLGHT